MMLKSYLTGPDRVPDERVREILLEEHLECGCACDETSPEVRVVYDISVEECPTGPSLRCRMP